MSKQAEKAVKRLSDEYMYWFNDEDNSKAIAIIDAAFADVIDGIYQEDYGISPDAVPEIIEVAKDIVIFGTCEKKRSIKEIDENLTVLRAKIFRLKNLLVSAGIEV